MNIRYYLKQATDTVVIGFKILNIVRRGVVTLATNPMLALTALSIYQIVLVEAQVLSSKKLEAYYPMAGDALDYSGNGRHLISEGAMVVEGIDGKPNGAYLFGTNANLHGSADGFQLEGPKTVAFWFKLSDSEPRGAYLFGVGGKDGAQQESFIIVANNCLYPEEMNTIEVQAHYDNKKTIVPVKELATIPSEWIHVSVVTSQHYGTRVYINGERRMTTSIYIGDTFVKGSQLVLGSIPGAGGRLPAPDVCKVNYPYSPVTITKALMFGRAISHDEAIILGKAPQNATLFNLPDVPKYDDIPSENNWHRWAAHAVVGGVGAALGSFGAFGCHLKWPYVKPKLPEQMAQDAKGIKQQQRDEKKMKDQAQLAKFANYGATESGESKKVDVNIHTPGVSRRGSRH
jgi:hypothetical protein